MNNYLKPLVFYCLLITAFVAVHPVHAQSPDDWEEHDAILVGRISHVEGEISRYDPETDRWVSTTREAPLGIDDLLRTDSYARAEIILPNNTWARIDGDSRLQLTVLTAQVTEVDLPHGNGRFYNKSDQTEMNATTPFGRITAPPGSAFDLYIGETGVEVVAVQNSVYFFHNASNQRHEVRADAAALSADMQEVTAVAGDGDPDWSAWNRSMDALWAERMASRGKSATYLPPELHSEAHALDKHGHWERVYYNGHYYRFWRPVHISASWSPFSWGAWVVWHGDHVWIPHEPFGYVTHHYGNWIFTAGHWYWAPPVTRVMVRARLPLLHIGFGWYPGRVSWIYSGAHVGWIPLGPHEPYYTHRHWGRRSIVSARWHHHRHRVYKHRRHAVVIHRSHLYRSGDYRHARVRDISHTTIRKKFRTARLLDRKVLKDNRHREKHDRFHRKHRLHKPGSPNQVRRKGDRRLYAPKTEDRHRLRRDRHRAAPENDMKSRDGRHFGKLRNGKASQQIEKGSKANRRPDKKRRTRVARKYHREENSKETIDRTNRLIPKKPAGDKRKRLADTTRAPKQKQLHPQRSRRFERADIRKRSRRLETDPNQQKTDRRNSRIKGTTERQRSGKTIRDRRPQPKTRQHNGAASLSRDHHRTKKEIKSHRSPSQRRQGDVSRSARRGKSDRPNRGAAYRKRQTRADAGYTTPKRQPQRSVRAPATRKAPERSVSNERHRPQRSRQEWNPSSGRRADRRAGALRSAGSGRHHRRQ